MLKKDVLRIITAARAAKVIGVHRSQITRMGSIVPEQYQKPLIQECRKVTKRCTAALERLKGNVPHTLG